MDGDINITAQVVEEEIQKKYGAAVLIRPSKKKTSLNLYQHNAYIGSVQYKGNKHTMKRIMDDVYKIMDARQKKHTSELKNNTIKKAKTEFKEKIKKIINENDLLKPVTVNGKKFMKDTCMDAVADKVFNTDGMVIIENNGTSCYYFAEEERVINETAGVIEKMPFIFCGDKAETMVFYKKEQIDKWCRINKQWITKIPDKILRGIYKSAKVCSLNPVTIEYNIGKYVIGKGWLFNDNYRKGMKILEEARKKKINLPEKPEHITAEFADRKLICNCYGHIYEYDTYGWKKDGLQDYFKKIRDAFYDVNIKERNLSASIESSFIAQALYGFVKKNQNFVTVRDAVKELRGLKHTGKTIYKEISENGVYNMVDSDDILMEIEEMERHHFFSIERMYWKYGDYYVINLIKDIKFGTEIQSDTFYDDIINEKPVPDTVALQFFNYAMNSNNTDIKTFMDCLHLLKYQGFICRYQEQYINFMKTAPKGFKQYLQMQKSMSDGFEKKVLIKILKK